MSKLIVGVNDLATVNPELAKEWDYEKNEKTPQDYTSNSGQKVWWKCKENHSWLASITKRNKGHDCPYCKGNLPIIGKTDLATVHPELLKEWNYEKNAKHPYEYTKHSNQLVWWKCDKGHEWQAKICNRCVGGTQCPYCKGKKVIVGVDDLVTVNPSLVEEWNYERNTTLPQNYKGNSHAKVWWKCKKGHEWQAVISSRHSNNRGCPYCSGRLAIVGKSDLETVNPNILKEWDYERNTKEPNAYMQGSHEKVWWVCSKGHNYQQTIRAKILKGMGCPYCSGRLPIVGETDLVTVNPTLVKEWNYDKNKSLPQEYTHHSGQKVWWKCKKGHEWIAVICDRASGNGCPYCSGRLPIVGKTDLLTVNPNLAKEWDYERNSKSPQEYTSGSNKKVWWNCREGHVWKASIEHRSRGRGCPYCSGSKTERLVYNYLKELEISFIAEKKFEQDIRVKWFPFDVWISSKRLIIEPDGMQHFTNKIGYFEQDVPFDKRRKNDNIKNQFCLEQKIPILRIPYTYNPDTEKEKIKSLIKDFIETRKIPQEIIDFYEQYNENNNYAEIATYFNSLVEY